MLETNGDAIIADFPKIDKVAERLEIKVSSLNSTKSPSQDSEKDRRIGVSAAMGQLIQPAKRRPFLTSSREHRARWSKIARPVL